MQEMGVRIALGAAGTDIRRLILLRIVALVGVGIAIGLVGVMALGRLVQGLLFGVGATDPAIFVTGAVLLTAVAVLAGAIPARRAARVDPVSVLKAQ